MSQTMKWKDIPEILSKEQIKCKELNHFFKRPHGDEKCECPKCLDFDKAHISSPPAIIRTSDDDTVYDFSCGNHIKFSDGYTLVCSLKPGHLGTHQAWKNLDIGYWVYVVE